MLFFILFTIFVQIFQLHALCEFPQSSQTISVPSTIRISEYKNFDYTTFVGGDDILNGGCDVNNGNMQYLMVLADGVTIENAIIDRAGMGIYCEGNCILKNIFFKTLCYHGAGFGYKSTDISYTYQVIGGAAQGSPDKYFTQSGRGTTIIQNFCAEGSYGKLWCSCGNCEDQMQRNVQMSNVRILGPGLAIASLNDNFGDTASISELALYGQNSPNTATKYVCQTYNGAKSMKYMHPTAEFLPSQQGGGPCTYSLVPMPNDNPDNNQPGGYYNQPGANFPYVITGGSGRVRKTIARTFTVGLLLVSSIMLNGVGATAAAGNTNVVDHQQALAAKPSSAGGWKPPPALLPEFNLGHLNASHVLQNVNSNEGTGNANNGRRGNLRFMKKAKKPAVVHEINAKTVDAPISRQQNVFGAKARIVPPETDCIYISLYNYP
uniref:Probable pectate lyase F n=1 Tax=Globodera pallida TaxID=36090 RepID=A0A183C1I6_GLOPA